MLKTMGPEGTALVEFTLDAAVGAETATVCGEWNGWSVDAHPMVRHAGGNFSCTVTLPTGRRYRFRYLLDGCRWENDWDADAYVPNEFGDDDSVVDLTGDASSVAHPAPTGGTTATSGTARRARPTGATTGAGAARKAAGSSGKATKAAAAGKAAAPGKATKAAAAGKATKAAATGKAAAAGKATKKSEATAKAAKAAAKSKTPGKAAAKSASAAASTKPSASAKKAPGEAGGTDGTGAPTR